MNRGEVWWVDFDNSREGEIKKKRPAIIVSNDFSNKRLNRLQIIPLTSNIEHCYPCEAFVELKGVRSKALATQITTAAKSRLVSYVGKLSAFDMQEVERAVLVQLGIKLQSSF